MKIKTEGVKVDQELVRSTGGILAKRERGKRVIFFGGGHWVFL
jgi:hypothetical protein